MKKILSFICACSMVFAVTACGSQGSVPAPGTTAPASSQETGKEVQQTEPLQSGSGENASVTEETGREAGSDILVAYFSATGTTKTLAGYISEVTGGDLYEIVPEIPYSSEDLNYSDNNSRSTREQNDEGARPAISGSVEDMDQYGTIFLGYPIWWGGSAWPVNGFVKANDFTGETVIPFCTSASSALGQSGETLAQLAGTGDWQEGQRFGSSAARSDVADWLTGLGFTVR